MKKIKILFILSFVLSSYSYAQYPQKIQNSHRILALNIDNLNRTLEEDIDKYERIILNSNSEIVLLECTGSKTTDDLGNGIVDRIAKGTKMRVNFVLSEGNIHGLLTKEQPISIKDTLFDDNRVSVIELGRSVLVCPFGTLSADNGKLVEKITDGCSAYDKPVLLFTFSDFAQESQTMKLLLKNWNYLNNPGNNQSGSALGTYIFGYTKQGEVYSKVQSGIVDISEDVGTQRSTYLDLRYKTKAMDIMGTIPYLQNPNENEVSVMWLTNVPCRSWIEYGTDSVDMKRVYSSIDGVMIANNKVNRIRLTDLKPATKYYYRVVSQEITVYSSYYKEFGDTVRSSIKSFSTWDKNRTDFRMIVFNDVHRNFNMFKKLFSHVNKEPYDLVVFNGDCFDDLEREGDLTGSLSTYTSVIKNDEIPSVFIRGNHENRGQYSLCLRDYVEQMNNTPYGAFSLGDTRFVILDTGEDKPDNFWVYYGMNDFTQYRINQAKFLKKELASNEFINARKRILIHHIPLWGNRGKYEPCAELWNPILHNAPFDIALNGHIHTFRYIRKNEMGNTYPVVIGGGKTDSTCTIIIVDKKGTEMAIRVLDINGNVLLELECN
ncbi:purple acid phosphatase family protein [Dysgonomonas reticulitermitis]|nr:endonuclease [Bacteroidia bacterium]